MSMNAQQIMEDVSIPVQTLLAAMLAPVILVSHWLLTTMDA